MPPTLWGAQGPSTSLQSGARRAEAEEEVNPVERAQMIAQLRRQLHGLSEHSRHLLTVPLTARESERGGSSTGGTFREFLHACTSEDMVLIPPSCLEARRRLPEAPIPEAGVAVAAPEINGAEGPRAPAAAAQAKAKTVDDILPALMQLPMPHVDHDDDEECDCERYAVSRQRDGRLIWSPEPLPAG